MNAKRSLAVGLVAAALVATGPAPDARAEEPGERERAEEMAREAMEQLLRAIEMFLQSIPQYEMPEVTEEGDIIIRRKRRPERPDPVEPELDETTT